MACDISIVTGGGVLYWADDGTAFPDVDTTPGASWNQIGKNTSQSYTEAGIHILFDETLSEINSLASIDPECLIRTARNMRVTVEMMDLSLDHLRVGFNFNAVSDETSPTRRELSLDVGTSVAQKALLLRMAGKSPESSGLNLQFEFEHVVEMGAKDISFVKDAAAAVALEFRVLAGAMKVVAGDT